MTVRAFWLDPDWSGGDNLRDSGTRPFWMRPPLRLAVGGGQHIPLLRKGPPAPSSPWGEPLPARVVSYGTASYNTAFGSSAGRGTTTSEPAKYHRAPGRYIEHGEVTPDHTCGPFVTLWTGYRYCKVCEKPAE